jgi:ribokinase
MNEAHTLSTELNSLLGFDPHIPEEYKNAKYLFLANIDPEIQLKVINAMKSPELIVLDTMNFWISNKKEKLLEAIKKSNILIMNDAEARQLFSTPNLVKAAKQALELGIDAIIIKKGEHGSLLFTKKEHFSCPGYPLENVIDPTGCGDSFGGAFIGHYSKHKSMRKAMVYGSVIASFNAEGFGLENLKKISTAEIEKRYKEMIGLREF